MIRCSTSLIFREVQIKTKMSYYLVHIKIAAIKKKQKITAVGEDVEKFKPLCAVAGTVKWSQPLWKTVWRSFEKLKIELPYDLVIQILGSYPKKLKAEPQRDMYKPMFIPVLFTKAKRWKQPKCWSLDEWINNIWFIYTMEYYSAFKRKEILSHAITRMNLEDNMLNKINQSQKEKYLWVYIYGVCKVVKFIEKQSRMVVISGCGEGIGSCCLKDIEFSSARWRSSGRYACYLLHNSENILYLTLLNSRIKLDYIVHFILFSNNNHKI